MKLTRENYISIQNLCKKDIIDCVESRMKNGHIVTDKFLDNITDSMSKVTKHIGDINNLKLREIAVGYILECCGVGAFGVDNGIVG